MDTKATNENILMELNKAVKALHFYPEGHPNLDGTIERFYAILTESLATKENIIWSVNKSGFCERNQPIAQTKNWAVDLAKEFFIRRIKKITFSGEITMGGLKTFLSIFKEEPENLLRGGGVGKQLAEEGAAGITLEDVIYEDFHKLTEEVRDKEATEEETVEVKGEEGEDIGEEKEKEFKEGRGKTEMEIETPSGIAGQEAETGEQMGAIQAESLDIILQNLDKLEETQKSLYELLKELEQERDAKNYLRLVNEIREKIEESQDEKKWDDLFSTLEIFLLHSTSKGNKPKDVEAIAQDNLKELLTNDTIIYLLNRLCRRKEEKRHAIQQMLLTTGESGVNLLLNALPDTKEAHARRHLYNTLLLFGEAVRDEAERRIDDERWFIVRQMVALLGEIGNPQSILALKKALIHPEPRVRKEVIKSLGRIPCKESSAILLRTLKDSDKSFVLNAITSLCVLKEQAAIGPLGGIALHKDTFSENINLRKAAVKALGLIGDEKAIPILTELLSRKVWFGKRGNEEIRALAVISLGKIGGETAYKIIEDTTKTARGIVLHACERSLKASSAKTPGN
jgi:hypothetical protein